MQKKITQNTRIRLMVTTCVMVVVGIVPDLVFSGPGEERKEYFANRTNPLKMRRQWSEQVMSWGRGQAFEGDWEEALVTYHIGIAIRRCLVQLF